uniref:DNA-directed DNA polymerase n=1 Tax=Porodaedalea pini TaxID=108901 RepID=A0A5B9RCL8_9AGAM|nr:DNA polymerase family B [Porodaedalea pini]QEG57039.1 DNA polymerase family B [Porodaedalea pini]
MNLNRTLNVLLDVCLGDVYKPTNEPDTKVYSYDVNSLYPFSMKEFPMPIGMPKYFEGDITKIKPDAFGIFEVEVQAPKDLYYPVIQTKVQTPNGNRTIAPVGNWSGVYFSEEIKNAETFGYKFKILKGYLFEKGFIFTEYVDFLYKLKANSTKGTPNYLIVKLLLNSLYGKFGMDPENDKHVIIDSDKAKQYHNNYVVTNVIDLGNNKELISYYKPVSDKIESNKPSSKNISVPVALAITAYARIHMSLLKKSALSSNLDIFYMDTDSLSLNGELDPKFIGTELGKLKLEHIFNEVIYLAPKVYAGKTDTYEYVKIKGLKNPISFDEMKPLLNKGDSLQINQEKWYKHINEGLITVKNEIYTLMLTDNKRELLFTADGIFTDTNPYVLSNGSLLTNKDLLVQASTLDL